MNLRKSYSLDEKTIQAISVIASELRQPESQIVQRFLNIGMSKEIMITPMMRMNANAELVDQRLNYLCKVLEILPSMQRKVCILTFVDVVGMKMTTLHPLNTLKTSIFELFEIIEDFKEVNENEYAEVIKHMKTHRRLCKFFNIFRTSRTPSEDTINNNTDSVTGIKEPIYRTDDEILKERKPYETE